MADEPALCPGNGFGGRGLGRLLEQIERLAGGEGVALFLRDHPTPAAIEMLEFQDFCLGADGFFRRTKTPGVQSAEDKRLQGRGWIDLRERRRGFGARLIGDRLVRRRRAEREKEKTQRVPGGLGGFTPLHGGKLPAEFPRTIGELAADD